jgi:ABC-2 type transport system permease protein
MRILELASRNLKENYRDPLALGFLLGFPLVFMIIFVLVFGGDSASSYPVGVIDNDNTELSQTFIDEALGRVEVFEIATYDDDEKAMKDLKFGDLSAYVIIPQGFGGQVSRNWQGVEADIVLNITYDESDIMTSEQIISIINTVTRTFADIEIPLTVNANPIHVETEITNIDFMAPGIIVFGLLIMIPTSARIMVRDKEKGFLARLLTTPTHPVEFISGYTLSLAVIAIAQTVIFMLVGWAFGMDIVGNFWLAFFVFFLTGLCSIGIGMVVASLSKSENQAEPLCWLFSMPLAILSGSWFSTDFMPSYLKTIANVFPYAHSIEASRAVLTRGVGMEAISSDFLFLVGWAVAAFLVGVILFRTRSMRV